MVTSNTSSSSSGSSSEGEQVPTTKTSEMEDLFGSDFDSEEEAEFKASGVTEMSHPERRTTSEPASSHLNSTLDADMLSLPDAPKISLSETQTELCLVKMPNIITIRSREYTEENIEKEMDECSEDKAMYQNAIRWRKAPATVAGLLSGETEAERKQTNTKLVQWDDGSLTLYIGKEMFAVSKHQVSNGFVFVNQTSLHPSTNTAQSTTQTTREETVLECHYPLEKKLTLRPVSFDNASHRGLTMSVRSKRNRGARSLKHFTTEKDPEQDKIARIKATEDLLKLEARKKAREEYTTTNTSSRRSMMMDADFLEADGFDEDSEDEMEYDEDDLSSIKAQFSSRGASSVQKTKKSHKKQSTKRVKGGFDEYQTQRKQHKEESESDDEEVEDDEVEVRQSSKRTHSVEEDEDEDEDQIQTTKSKRRKTVLLDDDDDDDE